MRGCGWSVARLRGLVFRIDLNLGFRSRSTPGFILMPAPQAEEKYGAGSRTLRRQKSSALAHLHSQAEGN